ncbi:hypothetical protein [Litoribacillus peritrichatus]|uniref:Ligand-binding SRPBCC domain-containing protein n=1 Tax=Litoribacillus peritrichatus TaxID=718191 RepID=A0ABP7M6K2_9GAMM
MVRLTFKSTLNAKPEDVWAWALSEKGINSELRPLLKMTALSSMTAETANELTLGQPIAHSWLMLFGIIPIDRSELTFVEFESGKRFLEQSPMFSMKQWQHERVILPAESGTVITDTLLFDSLLWNPLSKIMVSVLFRNRHKKLKAHFG